MPWKDGSRTVKVEATVSSGGSRGVEIEGVKVRLPDTLVEIVPTSEQLDFLYAEIMRRL